MSQTSASHDGFVTVERKLDWNAPMYRLYEKAKRNNWNPADIDFSQDAEDVQKASETQINGTLPLVASFAGGEEAVTLDILPMMHVLAKQGRLEDVLFLTTFHLDEAKHTEMFARWMEATGIEDRDLSVYHGDSYKKIFYEALPKAMDRLMTDDSPEAVIRAATTYHMVVEGILAESGYFAFRKTMKQQGMCPGILRGIDYLNQDEGRHLQFGIYTIQRLIVEDEKQYHVFRRCLDELLPDALGVVNDLLQHGEQGLKEIGVDTKVIADYALKQYHIRESKVARARQYESIEAFEAAHKKSED